MMAADLEITLADHVATIEIRRPPHNFIDNELIKNIADAYEAFDRDAACRAIVLCSEGKNFCAGADYDPDADKDAVIGKPPLSLDDFFEQVVRIFRARTPVVAAVQGAAVGGGLGLAVSADFRVTCDEGRFSANFVRLGFNPGFGLPITLPALVGEQRARLMCLTGRRIRGEEAFRWGLADALVPRTEVRSAAHALAGEIAAAAPLAVASTRATMRGDLADRIEAANAHDLAEQHRLRDTSDWQEGIAAVAARREPVFRGE